MLQTGTSPEEKAARRGELIDGPLRTWSAQIEAQIQGPFVCGERVFVADLKLFTLCHWLTNGSIDHMPPSVLDNFPKFVGVHRAVAAHPAVAAFRARYA